MMWTCILAALVATVTSAPSGTNFACSVTSPDGQIFDLSSLTSTTDYVVKSNTYAAYVFRFNVCGSISYEDPEKPNVCPKGETSTCEMLVTDGKEQANDNYGLFKQAELVWNTNTYPGTPGPLYISTAGKCPRDNATPNLTSRIYFQCDPARTTPIVEMIDDNYWSCYVNIKFKTDKVCPEAATKYRCLEDTCVPATTGVDKSECDMSCGPDTYRCEDNMCKAAATGVSKDECDRICGGPFADV
mmetsp:Transcript_89442/g.124230  ORF Transcript_89442/g.124230 Transcript_89442/m.124230 type:complete len:244 (-) Transcript_89442:123-854(-)